MAKVYMPLLSAQASGKLAKSMVHFYWKGLNVVRQWVIPTNPRDVDQRIARQKLAAMGKNLAAIKTPTPLLVSGAQLYQLLVAETPANMIWNAYFVKKTLDFVKNETNFAALSSALFGTATITEWRNQATALGFDTLTGDNYATAISPELQLFMGAYGAYQLSLSSITDIYSTYPSNWANSVIQHFATDYITGS